MRRRRHDLPEGEMTRKFTFVIRNYPAIANPSFIIVDSSCSNDCAVQMMPGRLTDNANTKGHAIDFIKIGVDPKDGSMGVLPSLAYK